MMTIDTRIAELVRTVEIWPNQLGDEPTIVKIYRHCGPQTGYFPIVSRRVGLLVRPSFVETVANEELDIVDRADRSRRFVQSSQRRVLADVLRTLHRSPSQFRLVEIVQTLEIGPYECAGEAPWQFIVRVYRDLGRRATYFPVVSRRGMYRLRRRGAKAAANEQVEILESSFESERFVRKSERAAAAAIVGHLRRKFEPGRSRRRRS